MTKEKVIIRPFNISSVLYILVVFIFVVMSLIFLLSGINNGFEIKNAIGMIVCAVLSCFFIMHFSRYVFAQKIELYDDYFVISYVKNFKELLKSAPFKLVPIEKQTVLYSEIEKYGFFLQKDLRKGGRNDRNQKVLLFSAGKVPVPFIVPNDVEKTQNVMIYNLKNEDSISVDASLYSYSQIQNLFWYLQKMSGVRGKCSENPIKMITQIPIVRISIVILLIVPGVTLVFGLRYLDSVLNPAHPMIYESIYIRIYTLGSFFTYVFFVGVIVAALDKGEKGEKLKPFMLIATVISAILTVACFIVSAWFT